MTNESEELPEWLSDMYYDQSAKIDIMFYEEVVRAAKKVWSDNYSDEYGYVTEKLQFIDSFHPSFESMFMIINMFDHQNKLKLWAELSDLAQAMFGSLKRYKAAVETWKMPDL